MPTVVLCGMPDEERILTRALPGILVLSGTAKLQLGQLVPPDCTRIVSMGLCGGLSPELAVPDVAAGVGIIDKSGDHYDCDPIWLIASARAAGLAGIVVKSVPWYSSGLMDEADDTAGRDAIWKKYGASAIDDESRFAVAEAERRGIKFNVIRPLSDAYDDNLPLMARGKIMNPDGSPNLGYLVSVLGQDQGADAEFIGTVVDHYRKSLDALEALAGALAGLITEKAS